MKRLFKGIAWLLGGLVGLLVVAVVVVPLLFDPNDHKQRIAEQIGERTGLAVRIQGDIGLTVFPWLGVTLGTVELGQPPGFEGDVFARTEAMQVRVKLLPLLERQVEMDTVTIDGLVLNLARDAGGRGNWQPLLEAGAAETPGQPAPPGEEGPPVVAALAIGGLDLREATVRWNDALTGQAYTVSNLALRTGALDLARPVDVSLAFDVEGGTPRLAGNVALDASVELQPEAQVLVARNLSLVTDLSSAGPLGENASLSLSGDLAASGAAQTLKVDRLQLTADVGRVAALDGPAKLSLSGDLAASAASQQVSLAGMRVEADLAGKALPGGKARVTASGELSADLAAQRVVVTGLEGELSQVTLLGASAGLVVAGKFDGDLGAQRYDLAGARFSGQLAGYPAPDSRVAFDGAASIRVDAAASRFAVADLDLELPGLKLPTAAGDLRLRTTLAGDYGAGKYVAKKLDLSGALAGEALGGRVEFTLATGLDADTGSGLVRLPGFGIDGAVTGEQIPGGRLPFEVTADIGADTGQQRLDVKALSASAGPLAASGEVAVSRLFSGPTYKGRLTLSRFNPRELMGLLGQPAPDTADPKALTAAELSTGIAGSTDDVTLDPLDLVLDGQRVRGRLQVVGFARPGYRFDLSVDRLDADRYLPPQPAGGAQAATPGAAAGAAAGLPVDTLRALDAQGSLRVGLLEIANLKLTDIVLRLDGKDGLVQLSPLGAKLYGGSYAGNVTLDARGQQTRVAVDEALAAVQLGPLLSDLKGLDTLSGRADVQLRANALGPGMEDVKRTLNGDVSFRIQDGEFRGIDIARQICGLVSGGLAALGNAAFQSGEGGSTRFSDMTGTATVSNGVVVNPDMLVRSPLLRIDGRGQANLVTEQLDYTATANLVASCQGQGGLGIDELSRVPVPVRVTGSFGRPQYGLDAAALVQALAQTKLRQKLQQSLGLPVPQPAAPAPVPDAGGGIMPPRQPQQGQQAQQPPDPKKQAIEGLIKGLFGN